MYNNKDDPPRSGRSAQLSQKNNILLLLLYGIVNFSDDIKL